MPFTTISSKVLPSGSVIQVLQASSTTLTENNSNAYVDVTGVSQAITPSSTSNKIFVKVSLQFKLNTSSPSSDDDMWGGFRLLRDSTAIFEPLNDGNQPYEIGMSQQGVNSNRQKRDRWTFSYLDAPSSTSSLTYKVQSSNYSTNKIHVNEQSNIDGSSYIQLMEIKG